jgi:hypothetical protein
MTTKRPKPLVSQSANQEAPADLIRSSAAAQQVTGASLLNVEMPLRGNVLPPILSRWQLIKTIDVQQQASGEMIQLQQNRFHRRPERLLC